MDSTPDTAPPLAPTGLTHAEASARLAQDGPNALPGGGKRSAFAIVVDVLKEPMLLLLLAAGGVYLLLGDTHDALVLVGFAALTILIEIIQEGRTDRAINALRDLGAPQALVIRDGARMHVPAQDVVRDDLLVIAEGDRIAADGWVVEASHLNADEAILTGESVTVTKRALADAKSDPGEPPLPGGDDLPFAFAGTLAVRGNGVLRVAATGPRCRMGQIGQSLASLKPEAPRLTVQTRQLVRWFALVGMGVSLLAALLYGLFRGGWLDAALTGIALAMSMLPEEFPVVLALFMTMGSLRLSRVRVLARRGSAIESLGAATVLCTDKTGTLTENRMEIAELCLPDGRSFIPGDATDTLELPQDFVELAGLGVLACLEHPFDPMETAFHTLAGRNQGADISWRQKDGWTLRRQYGLDPALLAMSHVWSSGKADADHVVATKGAPEAIADLCAMDPAQRAAVKEAVTAMAAHGLRVLGVAEARWQGDVFPDTQHGFAYAFRGLIGLADPIRAAVPDAVRQLQDAGVRVVMITGDYPATAAAIAAQAGIAGAAVMTGAELSALDDAALAARVHGISTFARVMPEQKLRIVQALIAAGEIVAMTGDGVNDAPSLQAAHIGIAMGKRGTDVAREASAIVLLDDDFAAIPAAMRLGRRIYDNLRKAMSFIFAVHIPIGGLALLPLLAGWPIILGPMHIALLEMIVDPICSLAFEAEAEEADIMRRKPRPPESPLFPRRLLAWSVLQGALAIALLVGLMAWGTRQTGMSEEVLRAITFAALVAEVLVLVFVNRALGGKGIVTGLSRNTPFAIILGVLLVVFALLFGVPAFAGLFRFALPGWNGLAAAAMVSAVLLAMLGAIKQRFRHSLSD